MNRTMRDGAMARSERAISIAMKRKEEFLGARVPKELRDRVIASAKQQGIPVSILIRNVLEQAFNVDENCSVSVSVVGENKFDSVLGWERIVLNKPIPCTNCGVQLSAGMDVTLGIGGQKPVILCDKCKSGI